MKIVVSERFEDGHREFYSMPAEKYPGDQERKRGRGRWAISVPLSDDDAAQLIWGVREMEKKMETKSWKS